MKIRVTIWKDSILDKIQSKHGVSPEEVEYVLEHGPHVRYIEGGKVKGENVYAALGQTQGGRYLIVFFIDKKTGRILPISARDMTDTERSLYARQKKRKG